MGWWRNEEFFLNIDWFYKLNEFISTYYDEAVQIKIVYFYFVFMIIIETNYISLSAALMTVCEG